jgi:hypothetical protein
MEMGAFIRSKNVLLAELSEGVYSFNHKLLNKDMTKKETWKLIS